MENPESYFEDFGSGTVGGGSRQRAPMSPDFAALVDVNTAMIFLTEYGDLGGLTCRATREARSRLGRIDGGNGTFIYRIVAKRKDVQAPRLQDVPVTTGTSNFVTPRDVKTPGRSAGRVRLTPRH